VIVSVFMLLVGLSLLLARRAGVTPRHFWRRIALIAFCAILVSVASYLTFPQTFITFGILHCIAMASVLSWPVTRFPLAALAGGMPSSSSATSSNFRFSTRRGCNGWG
jgi:uncharacterized membrane protein